MRCYISVVCAFSVLVALSSAAPAPQQGGFGFSAGAGLNTTALVTTFNQKVQLLRRFCPQIFEVIDNVVQNLTSQIFSVVGRVILRNGLGGGGGNGGGGESRVSVVLPTFPPDEDDYDDEEEKNDVSSNSIIESTTKGDLDVRIVDSRTTSTSTTSSGGIALSVNEIQTENAPFTGGNALENRLGKPDKDEEPFELFDDDCGGDFESNKPEKLVKTTSTEAVGSIEIANRNQFIDDTTIAVTTTIAITTDSEKIDTTTAPLDNTEKGEIDELKANSIDAIFKGIVEVENTQEIKESASTEKTDDSTTTQKEQIAGLDIKVVLNGSVVNTIPLIGENTINLTENAVIKRSPTPSETSRSRRVIREAEAEGSDQEAAASGGNGPDPADLSDVEVEDAERDKRYLPFGGGDAHVSAGGGSGNFLFDIIRN